MNIRTKVMVLVAGFFAILIVMEIVIQERGIMPSFVNLERADARTSMSRVEYALNRTLEGLEATAADWADWGELYQFMQTRSPAFLATYTTPETLAPLKVNLLMLTDTDGGVVFSVGQDVDSGRPLRLDMAALHSLPMNFPWRRELAAGRSARGLVRTNQGVMMLAAAPILDGSGTGNSAGWALFGRLLTPKQVAAIGEEAQASVVLDTGAPREALLEEGGMTHVLQPFNDIHGRAVMTLQVNVPRGITEQGHAAVNYSLGYLFGAAIMVLAFLIILLNRMVLDPIARVTRHAVLVGTGGDLDARLNFTGHDEISRFAREFDRMVEHVADSRRQLVDRAFQSGYAELARGIMHNLEAAMTEFVARLGLLTARLRAVPAPDVTAAAGELADAPATGERRADLARVVKLEVERIEAVLDAAHADLQVMERQAAIVTATLAEQRRSAEAEHQRESVRLPDLLSQALDIVPDHCRRRLVVQADDSLRAVGPVTVARTVLRLVLQNLLINAADAVQARGSAPGEVRLTAAIECIDGQPQLHLQCTDNGAGIAPENLVRVFERGFSTKPRTHGDGIGNEGIGLHWCANTIRSLGGRIWAVSEGPGRGASMHVTLPIPPAS
jgi:signal transduction histidine kinase